MGPKVAQSKMPAVQPAEFLFQEGERILCFHHSGDHLYEGIIQKAEVRNRGKIKGYLISLLGGKKESQDQWLSENLVIKYDKVGLAKKKELSQAHEAKINKKALRKATKRSEEGSSCSKTVETVVIKSTNEQNMDPKSSEDGSKKQQSPANLADASSPFTLITQVKYHNLLVKIFSGSTEKKQRQFFFEPLVFLDPKSIVSKSCSHGSLKQDFIRLTVQMWNEELRSKVLERLQSLEYLQNFKFGEEDICVMPFEDVQLVSKSGRLPNFISLTEKPTPYLRSNEDLDFYLLVDESSSANVLAHDIRQNPDFYLLNEWQLKLDCRGFATESETTSAESTVSQRSTRSYTISICSNEVTTNFPAALSASSSSVAKSTVKLPPDDTVDTDDPASSSGSTTTDSTSTLVEKEINHSNFADLVQQPPHSGETTVASLGPFIVSNIKYFKIPEGVLLFWEPLESTDGEVTEYSVYLATKRSSATRQSWGSTSTADPFKIPFVLAYCGPSSWCIVPISSVSSIRIDTNIKPAIIFFVSARNKTKSYGPLNQVMMLLDSCTRPTSALGEHDSRTVIASDLSLDHSNRPASASRSPTEVFRAETQVPSLDISAPLYVQEDITQSNLLEKAQQLPSSSQMNSDFPASKLTDQLVTISCLNKYPILTKEEPVDGIETSLTEAQVITIQAMERKEKDDQSPLSSAVSPTTKTIYIPITSQANLTTASPSIYPESGLLATHLKAKPRYFVAAMVYA